MRRLSLLLSLAVGGLLLAACGPKPGPSRPREPARRVETRPEPRRVVRPRRPPPPRFVCPGPLPQPREAPRASAPKGVALVPWRARPPRPGAAPPLATPKVRRRVLKNGLTVLLVRQPSLPLVSFRLVVRAGAYEDPTAKAGVASMTADMLNEGAGELSALQLSAAAGQLGASLGSHADEDGSYLSIGVLARHADAALDLLSKVALKPTFPAAELGRRKLATLNYIRRFFVYPSAVAGLLFRRTLFGAAHPYGRLDSGRPRGIKALTRADLLAYYKRHYRPKKTALVVVGDLDWKRLLPLAQRAFGSWQGTADAPTTSLRPAPLAGRLFAMHRPGAAQSELRVGEIGPARRHVDMVPLLVMNTILGGSFSGRINMNLREKRGYTYGAYSGFGFGRFPSAFAVRTAVKTAVTAQALREILKELRAITARPVSPAELDLARQFLAVSVSGWFVSVSGVARAVSKLYLHDLPLDFWARFPARVKAVTRADVQAMAQKHLHPDRVKVVVVGDLSRVGNALACLKLGPLKQLRP